jgi:hypothetical protein
MTALVGREVKRTLSRDRRKFTGLRRQKPHQAGGQYPRYFMKALIWVQLSYVEATLSGGIHICNMMSPTKNNSRNNGLRNNAPTKVLVRKFAQVSQWTGKATQTRDRHCSVAVQH